MYLPVILPLAKLVFGTQPLGITNNNMALVNYLLPVFKKGLEIYARIQSQ
jgi:hypothetical protein